MRIIILFILFLFSGFSFAAKLNGIITDNSGETIPFVAIYIEGTTDGTTSNILGEYSLELQPGNYKIVYKLIGFKEHTETVQIGSSDVTLNIQLEPVNVEIGGVTISANAEDPAYAIIRKAIKKRKYYLNQVDEYSCDAYIKGLQRIMKHPKKLFGQTLSFGNIDSVSGIIYLSESVSKLYSKQPDKIKEVMISSRVSGHNNGFSYNQESFFLFNFYKNNIAIDGLSERGFVSPISENALFYYKYHLVETFQEDNKTIDKIEVIPRRIHDPVFRGYIYIMENDWRIQTIDLYITKDAQIDFVDTLRINQVFIPVPFAPSVGLGDTTWMLFSDKISFIFDAFGIKGDGVYIAVNSNYNLKPGLTNKFFNGEVMKVDTDANKKDTSYWSSTRPIPLTKLEKHDYQKRDSLEKIHESKPWLDSIDKIRNKFGLSSPIFGYTYRQRYKKQTWYLAPLIQTIDFNTVQGLNIGASLTYSKEYERNRRMYIEASGGYGFSNQRWFGDADWVYSINPENLEFYSVGGGIKPEQFNGANPISPILNTVYTLLQVQNYMKLYQKASVHATHSGEIINGVNLQEGVEYDDRTPLVNATGYQLVHIDSREYSSNIPDNIQNDSMKTFNESKSFTGYLRLRIQFKEQYISRPNQKIILDSKYPAFTLAYRKAFGMNDPEFANYDFVKASIAGQLELKLLGESSYSVSTGKFLTRNNAGFMDYYHFNGDQTIFISSDISSFQQLDYYKYSTTGPFVEGHFVHNFEGFIFNKIPLLRKTKLNEVLGVNFLTTNAVPQYWEIFAGISKFQALQIDYVVSFMQNSRVGNGIRVGLGF